MPEGSKVYNSGLGEDEIVTSDDVKIEGFQISTTLPGCRVIGSVESEINGKQVMGWGLIYGLISAGKEAFGVEDADMTIDSEHKYVKVFSSTALGTIDGSRIGKSSEETCFVRTMQFSAFTEKEFNAEYKVRAYAVLEDGSYAYSTEISSYSIFRVAKIIYDNVLMNTEVNHRYLY